MKKVEFNIVKRFEKLRSPMTSKLWASKKLYYNINYDKLNVYEKNTLKNVKYSTFKRRNYYGKEQKKISNKDNLNYSSYYNFVTYCSYL